VTSTDQTAPPVGAGTLAERWKGQSGRLEVFYVTLSDPQTGIGLWVHHELVAPVEGEVYRHGWTAVFHPPEAPVFERFTSEAVFEPPALRGQAGALGWDLRWEEAVPAPLFTFPSWAWEREVLPGAQILPVPSACFSGSLQVGEATHKLSPETRGGVAHIYGHGSAERWGWLHADLGGGDVLEIVAATSRQPGLDHLPPMTFLQLRTGERDWPRDPLLAAPLLRATLGLPTWRVGGTVGRWRIRVEVDVPDSQSVSVGYVDPDGATATCTNSEAADADIVLEHRRSRWETAARWSLRGTAHTEIGTRP
jgi:hypothetical protein